MESHDDPKQPQEKKHAFSKIGFFEMEMLTASVVIF